MSYQPGPQDRLPDGVPHYGAPQPHYGAPPMGSSLSYGVDPAAPFGREPATGLPYSDKSKVAAGLLQLFFGTLGVGRFYMGSTGIAIAQLALTLVGWMTAIFLVGFILIGAVGVWALFDAILILVGRPVDGHGRPLRS